MSTEKIAESIVEQFDSFVKNYRNITLLFFLALFVEGVLLIFFFPFLVKSAFFSITLAAFLITLFSFYTLRNYQVSEKEEKLRELVHKYVKGALSLSPGHKTPRETKQIAADACLKLARTFKGKGKTHPFLTKIFRGRFEDFMGGQEERKFREFLFEQAVEEFSGQIRLNPTDCTAHASLAEAYRHMAALWFNKPRYSEILKKAGEEIKIVSELTPNDPLILEKLAENYAELGDTSAQVATLEKALSLDPQRPDVLYRLGCLYFSQGQASRGFKIYETLKTLDPSRGDQLMAHYR